MLILTRATHTHSISLTMGSSPDLSDSLDFTSDTTCLVLAAHKGNYAIISYLVNRGHRIETPHHLECKYDMI